MPLDWLEHTARTLSEESALALAILILVFGLVAAYLVWRWTHSAFRRTGLQDIVQGTTVERSAGRFGTSTASVVAALLVVSVYALALLVAFNVARVIDTGVFWPALIALLPQLLIAIFALLIGVVLGDKAKLVVQDRLRSVKLPEAALLPEVVKYSVFYIAALIALAQVGVATAALLVLLAAYAFGVVVLLAVALKDLLTAGTAGIYLLLNEPYSIGDEIRIEGNQGVVQEVDMFVTHIEGDGEEYVIPNNRVFRSGIVRIRD